MTYPFTDDQKEQMPMFEMKWAFIMQKLDDKYKNFKKNFLEKQEQRNSDQQFEPRLVTDEPKKDGYMD